MCLSKTQFISNCFSELVVILKIMPSLRVELMFFWSHRLSVDIVAVWLSSGSGCSVSEGIYMRTEKRYFSGVRNFVIYLAIFVYFLHK